MGSITEELLALFEIDRELVTLKRQLDAGPEEIRQEEQKISILREARRETEALIKTRAMQVDQINLDIGTAEEEIDDQSNKLRVIKNNKEYKIVTERIKELKQTITVKENAAIEIMEELDKLREELKEKSELSAASEARVEELKKEIEIEREKIRNEGKNFKESREAQVQKLKAMDVNAVEAYSLALRRGQGIAMAEMVGGVCQLCFRRASPNIENAALVGREPKKCSCAGCGRILYSRQDNTAQATE